MRFESDEAKNRLNVEKHGVSFEQAMSIFDDFTVDSIDRRFDDGESRELSIGLLEGVAVLVVVHTDRNGLCRIISARQTRKDERKRYEQAVRQATDG